MKSRVHLNIKDKNSQNAGIQSPGSQNAGGDPENVNATWTKLRDAIHEIHRHNASVLSFEELYRSAYYMVLHGHGDHLYTGLKSVVLSHVQEVALRMISTEDEDFLRALHEAWSDHQLSMVMVRDILMYMDRAHAEPHAIPTAYEVGLILFNAEVVQHPRLRPRLVALLLDAFACARRGEALRPMLLRGVLRMLVDLGGDAGRSGGHGAVSVYIDVFEDPFVEASARFFMGEAGDALEQCAARDYLLGVDARWQEERQRCEDVCNFAKTTWPRVQAAVERAFLGEARMARVLDMEGSGLEAMVLEDRLEDILLAHRLCHRLPGGEPKMREVLTRVLARQGDDLLRDPRVRESAAEFVGALLRMQEKYDRVWRQGLEGSKTLGMAVQAGIARVVNGAPRAAEFLSLHLDELLRKGRDDEQQLEAVMGLFRALQEKDVFERYYKQHLAKRLLLGASASDDAERAMIALLKAECGFQFTSKLEGMFADMAGSGQLMERYREYCRDEERLAAVNVASEAAEDDADPPQGEHGGKKAKRAKDRGKERDKGKEKEKEKEKAGRSAPPPPQTAVVPAPFEMWVNVLTTGFWPTQPSVTCMLPAPVRAQCERFRHFYMDAHSGRRLTWQTNMGTCELRAFYGKRKNELVVTTYQMCLLHLFNERDAWSVRELLDRTGIPEPDLRRNLQPLVAPRYKVLLLAAEDAAEGAGDGDDDGEGAAKPPPPTTAAAADLQYQTVLRHNPNFRSKLFRVKIMLGQRATHGESTGDRQATRMKVDEDRKHQIEAAIVRVMKARKQLDHANLVAEVTKILSPRFVPSPRDIRKRLDSLCEREYIQRTDDLKGWKYLS